MFNNKKKPSSSESVIKPTIRVNGENHILEDLLTGPEEKMPVLTSVGYCRVGTGIHSWVSYKITTQGEKVLSIEVDEPNMRAIAEESAKGMFVTSFIDQEVM